MPDLGFVLAQRKPSLLGRTLPKAAHDAAVGLKRYRCYSTRDKLIWMSNLKFKQHKELGRTAGSICALPSSWMSVYILLTIGTSAASKESIKYFRWACPPLSRTALGAKKYWNTENRNRSATALIATDQGHFKEKASRKNLKGGVFVTKNGLKQQHIGWFILGLFQAWTDDLVSLEKS